MSHKLSEATLRTWMDKMGPRLLTIATAICRDRHQAEEIVQEAFVKLWNRPPDAGEVAYISWLRRVVTNLSINALQRTRRPRTLPEFSSDPALRAKDQPARVVSERENIDRIRAAMDRLDPAKRTILILRAYEQLSYDEIATHLEIPIGTVMSRLNRARTALMEELQCDPRKEEAPVSYPFRAYKQA